MALAAALAALALAAPPEHARVVDGLSIACAGTGSPAVVLVSGLGVYSGTWLFGVEQRVARTTTVCRYDRPGLGQSRPATGHPDGTQMLAQLRALLAHANVPGPYVVVGASLGGLVAQLYARTDPADVAGVVLVDSLHPDFDAQIEKLLTRRVRLQRRAELELNRERIRFADVVRTEHEVAAAPPWPDLPLVVLRHGIPFSPLLPRSVETLWRRLQEDLAASTPDGKLVLAAKSGHQIEEQQPALVAQAIVDVVKEVRNK
jgi:pimeloyl-ACP methyl ester carboxylesterase